MTLNDILQAMIGELPTTEQDEPMAIPREDGTWLLDGMLPVSDLKDVLEINTAENAAEAEALDEFHTLGGFIMGRTGRVPVTGDHIEWAGWRFEVIDMDRRRVDKVLLCARAELAPA